MMFIKINVIECYVLSKLCVFIKISSIDDTVNYNCIYVYTVYLRI